MTRDKNSKADYNHKSFKRSCLQLSCKKSTEQIYKNVRINTNSLYIVCHFILLNPDENYHNHFCWRNCSEKTSGFTVWEPNWLAVDTNSDQPKPGPEGMPAPLRKELDKETSVPAAMKMQISGTLCLRSAWLIHGRVTSL